MSKQIGYRIPLEQKSCKFGRHYSDSVPMPFGSGNCLMPGFECNYEGGKQIPDDFICSEKSDCIAYEPEETFICPKHDIEYYKSYDWCELCHPDYED
jgi:hypothetical protein